MGNVPRIWNKWGRVRISICILSIKSDSCVTSHIVYNFTALGFDQELWFTNVCCVGFLASFSSQVDYIPIHSPPCQTTNRAQLGMRLRKVCTLQANPPFSALIEPWLYLLNRHGNTLSSVSSSYSSKSVEIPSILSSIVRKCSLQTLDLGGEKKKKSLILESFGSKCFWTHYLTQGQGKKLINNYSEISIFLRIRARRNPR